MAALLIKDVLRFVCMESGELSVIDTGAHIAMLRLCADSWVILLLVSVPVPPSLF